jgi:hypothetical protein
MNNHIGRHWLRTLAAIVALTMTVAAAPKAFAEGDVKLGYLSCHVGSGFGLVFGSSRELNCTYTPNTGEPEFYKGEINKFGADIGYLASGVMLWVVMAPSNTMGRGALAGHYAGATASATLGVGAGVNVLTGGMHDTIALQPISIEGNNGLNVAAGVATLNLDWDLKHEWGKHQYDSSEKR